MRDVLPIAPYIPLVMTAVSSLLVLVLALLLRQLAGRGWLVASAVLKLVSQVGFQLLPLLVRTSDDPQSVREVYPVLSLFSLFGTATFAVFLLAVWMQPRVRLDISELLFSFSRRVPRSVFWVYLCIGFPVGMPLGLSAMDTHASGFGLMTTRVVAGLWCLISFWMSLAVYSKRWHDCGRSAWMSLVLLIPVIGPFWFFGVLGFARGTAGPNRFGADPMDALEA